MCSVVSKTDGDLRLNMCKYAGQETIGEIRNTKYKIRDTRYERHAFVVMNLRRQRAGILSLFKSMDVRTGPKLGQIGSKWDKLETFLDQVSENFDQSYPYYSQL